jgi:hypothetical protein
MKSEREEKVVGWSHYKKKTKFVSLLKEILIIIIIIIETKVVNFIIIIIIEILKEFIEFV